VLLYYSNSRFRRVDFALVCSYFFKNPYRLSRNYLEKRGAEEVHAYGETPLFTLEQIAKECGITAKDSVLELGCGRARTCFWLALVLKAKTIGIDFVPEFIHKAEKIRERYHIENLKLIESDFLKEPLPHTSVVYLHGSIMTEEEIVLLNQQLAHFPKGTKVITVSFPLKDYPGGKKFRLLKSFSAHFSWGKAEVYCQELST
jgi:SAM-dependent methyltransferase